ncbi:MAG: helix-turn-helix transcriptional regulator [Bacteroidales bacterium]|nr:helix-turn-helix transcriptional regulator [Bacteroidales bacterium]
MAGNIMKTNIGKHIRSLRNQREETLHNVSMGTDIDSPLLSKIERGERLPTKEQLIKLANHFEQNEKELIAKLTAEKIIRDYGTNNETLDAILIVQEQIVNYLKKNK